MRNLTRPRERAAIVSRGVWRLAGVKSRERASNDECGQRCSTSIALRTPHNLSVPT